MYLTSVSLLSMFSLLGNVFVLNLDGRDLNTEKEMPKWVIRIHQTYFESFLSDYFY